MMQSSIAPGLLLAMPQLMDPNFSRSVVLMVEHSDQGSFGLIINQPIEMSAGELLENLDMEWNGDQETLVWNGGPVQPNSGWILHQPVENVSVDASQVGGSGTLEVCPEIWLSTSPDTLRILGRSPPEKIRLILGYSGWGPGQLASEMAHGSWLHADVHPDIIFDTPAEEMWSRALATLGIDPQTVVPGFGIH